MEALIVLYNTSEIDFSVFKNSTKFKLQLLESAYRDLKNTKQGTTVGDVISRCNTILASTGTAKSKSLIKKAKPYDN